MFEFRWLERTIVESGQTFVIHGHIATDCKVERTERVLQYRVLNDDGTPTGHLNWSEWRDVPTETEGGPK